MQFAFVFYRPDFSLHLIKQVDNISELFLMDMAGKNLKKVQATNTFYIQDVLKGTYILRVINKENKVYYLKLIKN